MLVLPEITWRNERVISSPNREHPCYICDECVRVCVSILREAGGESERDPFTVMAPGRNFAADVGTQMVGFLKRAGQDLRVRDEIMEGLFTRRKCS